MPDLTIHPYRLPLQGDGQASSSASYTLTGTHDKAVLGFQPRPIGPITYTFASVAAIGSNIVALSSSSADDRPTYFISTTMNVFMPMSFITSIYKGDAPESSEKVAEFEMGMSTSPAYVEIQTTREGLKSVLARSRGGRSDGLWYWTPRSAPDRHIEWDYTTGSQTARCVARRSRQLLATYRYSNHVPSRVQELEVTPAGQSYFDHLLLCLLVIERKRLTPRQSVLSKLWNF